MNGAPGMNDTAIIIMVVIVLLAGALIGIAFIRRGRRGADPHWVFHPGRDLRHFTVSSPERWFWFAATAASLAFIGLIGWMSQRNEAALAQDRAQESERQLARLGCAPKEFKKLLDKVVPAAKATK